jgi:glycosyltransferase involved in cell wall biosynthesis
MATTLISVIVPVHNREQLVVETIESLLTQTSDKWELLLVDDHSSDNSWATISHYASTHDNISAYSNGTNGKGANCARNLGMAHATSNWVMFLDSDDVIDAKCIENRIEHVLTESSSLGFFVFDTMKFKAVPGDMDLYVNKFQKEERDLYRFLKFDHPWLTTGILWNKSFLEFVGGWREDLPSWQDWEIHVRVLLSGISYKKIEVVDSYHRVPSDNTIGTSSLRKSHIIKHQELLLDLAAFVKDNRTIELLRLINKVANFITLQLVYSGFLEDAKKWQKKYYSVLGKTTSDAIPIGLISFYAFGLNSVRFLNGFLLGKFNGGFHKLFFKKYVSIRSRTFHKYKPS